MKVNVNDIYLPQIEEGNLRIRKINEPSVQEIAYSLQTKGLLNIPTVTKGNPKLGHKKPYEVGDGNGRIVAFLLIQLIANKEKDPVDIENGQIIDGTYLGKKFNGEIEINYLDKIVTPEERLENQITSNYNVKNSTNSEYINALTTIKYAHPEWGDQDLAKHIGITVAHLQRLFKTLKLPDSLREKLSTKELTLINAVTLSKLVNKCDQKVFDEFAEDALNLNQKDFAPKVESFLLNVRTENAEQRKNLGFIPKPKILGNTTILNMLEINMEEFENLKKNKKTPSETLAEFKGRTDILKDICSLDEKTIKKQKDDYDKKKQEQEDRKNKSKETREREKLIENIHTMVKQNLLKEKDISGELKNDYEKFKKNLKK
ncbi:MAG: hypothetical protein ACTSXT_13610 [Candidatus Helarchaeota archaeon]